MTVADLFSPNTSISSVVPIAAKAGGSIAKAMAWFRRKPKLPLVARPTILPSLNMALLPKGRRR